MGRSNGQKAAEKRARNAKKNAPKPGSNLKSHAAAFTLKCGEVQA